MPMLSSSLGMRRGLDCNVLRCGETGVECESATVGASVPLPNTFACSVVPDEDCCVDVDGSGILAVVAAACFPVCMWPDADMSTLPSVVGFVSTSGGR